MTIPTILARLQGISDTLASIIADLSSVDIETPSEPEVPVVSDYLVLPASFSNYLINPLLRKDSDMWVSDLNVGALKPARATTYYVDPVSGSDSSTGDAASPLRSVKAALGKPGDKEIVCAPGVYPYIYGPAGFNPSMAVSVVCHGGRAVFSNDALPRTWSEHVSYSGLFMAPCAVAGESWSGNGSELRFYMAGADPFGDRLPTRTVDQLIAGQVGVAVGNDSTAVRLPGNAAPSYSEGFNVKWVRDNLVISAPAGATVYLENITCQHGAIEAARFVSSADAVFISVNCEFVGGLSGNAATWLGGSKVINWECRADYGTLDGFNYHSHSSYPGASSAFEYGCTGENNGGTSSGSNNGSTIHDKFSIVRANCEFRDNQNRNVHDVGFGLSLNVACTSIDSRTVGTESFAFGHPSKADNVSGYMIDCVTDKITVYAGSSLSIDTGTVFDEINNYGTIENMP